MALSKNTKNILVVAMADEKAATEISSAIDSGDNTSALVAAAIADAKAVTALSKAYPSNYYMVGAGSIQDSINQAFADGHNDNNKAFIMISQDKTENITLKPGIFIAGLNSSGTHSPWVITGQVTINSVSGTIDNNHYAISGVEIVGPTTVQAVNFIGTSPQRLFLKDVWITANGIGGHCLEMNNSGSGSIVEADEIKFSHTGTGYALHILQGSCTVEDMESSGTISIARIEAGATLVINSSECDANSATAFDVVAGGLLTLSRCVIENLAANAIGINLLGIGAVAVVGSVLFNTTLAGTGRAINGVAGSVLYYQYIAFAPGASSKINPATTSVPVTTTPSFI
jgi:hypothetical protein